MHSLIWIPFFLFSAHSCSRKFVVFPTGRWRYLWPPRDWAHPTPPRWHHATWRAQRHFKMRRRRKNSNGIKDYNIYLCPITLQGRHQNLNILAYWKVYWTAQCCCKFNLFSFYIWHSRYVGNVMYEKIHCFTQKKIHF